MRRTVAVLARAPQPGRAKTRLAAGIGEAPAAAVARALVSDTLSRAWPADARVLWTAGDDRAWGDAATSGWIVREQREVDLGARQADAIADGLARTDVVVVSGCDAPDLPAALIEAAFLALRESDVVLTPAVDGGYVLLGSRRPCDGWLDGITWSTDRVLVDVAERILAAGLTLSLTPTWYDVDTVADLSRLALHSRTAHAAFEPTPPAHTLAVLRSLGLPGSIPA